MACRTILLACGLTSLALIVTTSLPADLAAANKTDKATSKRPLQNPKFDASAEQMDLFEAVDAGKVTVKLIPKDAMGGKVLIENKTDKPLTVKIPEAVVGVSVHAQLGNLFGGNQGLGNNQLMGNQGIGGMGGNTQMQGGGVQMQGNNGQGLQNGLLPGNNGQMQGNLPGMNLFSIPAEKVVSLTFNSVCLEHGKPEPDSSCKYTLVPVSKISKDPVLYQLLAAVGTGKVNGQAAQAAAWHLTDNMSFQELAEKANTPLGGLLPVPYFSREQINAAKQLLAQATERVTKANSEDATEVKVEIQTTAIKSGRNF